MRPSLLFTSCLAIALASGPSPRAAAQPPASQPAVAPLIIATQPGAVETAQRMALFPALAPLLGRPLAARPAPPDLAALAQALAGPAPPDVLLLPGDLLRQACQQALLRKLDPATIGGKDRYQPQALSTCGAGALLVATAVAWDRDKYRGPPPGWAEFWDIARIPGKRGLPRGPRITLEAALLADGVAPDDVYRQLRTPEGQDRAFRKLDQLRPYIVWAATPTEAVRILDSGDVLFAAAPTANIALLARSGRALAVQWTNALSAILSWALPAAPGPEDASRFIAAATDPAAEAQLQQALPYGGLSKGADDNLPAETAVWSTASHAHAMLAADEAFWRDNGEKLSRRFESWLQK